MKSLTARLQSSIMFGMIILVALILLACQITDLLPKSNSTTNNTNPIEMSSSAPKVTSAPVTPYVAPTVPYRTPTPTLVLVTATAKADTQIYAGPSSTAQVLDKLIKGQAARIVGRTAAKDWLQIPLPGNPNARGWIPLSSVTTSIAVDVIPVIQPTPTLTPTPKNFVPSPTWTPRPTWTPSPTLAPGQPTHTPFPLWPFGTPSL